MTVGSAAHRARPAIEPKRVPVVVVFGGSAWGGYIVRQLLRAAAAGRLEADQLVVVDRNPACGMGVDRAGAPPEASPVTLEVAEWSEWLDRRLDDLPGETHLVPYHWAPHLFFDWLARQSVRAGASVRKGSVPDAPARVPFARSTGDHALALSYATWTCPPTCIEPALCPHTRERKDWSLCGDLESPGAEDAIVLRCLHLAYGVATVPLSALFAARDRLREGLRFGPRRYRIATASHCHGLAATLELGPLRS